VFLSSDISFYIISLGCSKNLVDSEKINGEMLSVGFQRAKTPEESDIIIINTCGFIEDAKRESIDAIFEYVTLKDLSRNDSNLKPFLEGDTINLISFKIKVVVVGCLSQRYFDAIKSDIPEIDFLYRLSDRNFVRLLSQEFDIKLVKNIKRRRSPLFDKVPYSYIKISEGCSNNCSYCAIPLIRGKLISYPIGSIEKDAERAVRNGAKELIVVAQDIASYSYNNYHLPEVVNRLSKINGLEWIRLLYCHPDNLNVGIIKLVENNKKVVKYIDLPFQHISKGILRSMGRKGDYSSYYRLIMNLRERIPEIRIRSTFMIGYPGETHGDFSELLRFVEDIKLDRIGGFMYSREEGTRAFTLKNQVPEKIKRERYNRLMMIQKSISEDKMKEMIGKKIRVLIEDRVDDKTWLGRTEFDAPEVDGVFYLTGDNIVLNKIVEARVTSTTEYDLIGELC